MPQENKIFLIGFMGCGKTTHGKKLARALKKEFIDLDEYIEKKEGSTISRIFEAKGELYFRSIESECLKQILQSNDPLVASFGGGTPCFNDNMDLILSSGIVIYIEMSPEALNKRLSQSETVRPLLKNKSQEENLQYIKDLLQQRESFYARAHITLNGINLTTDKLKEALSLFIGEN